MKELHSEIEINAPAQHVWEVLTDFASYPQWNPFIRRASGVPRTGERLEVRMEPSGSRGMTLRPKVLDAGHNCIYLSPPSGPGNSPLPPGTP